MKRLWIALVACLCLMGASTALAEGQTVTLGDGSPIPYFEGFESSSIADPSAVTGITGAIEGSYVLKSTGGTQGSISRTITLQNIAVTDDFYALFFKMTYDAPIPFPDGKMQFNLNWEVPFVSLYVNGSTVDFLDMFLKEAHLISDRELMCMAAYSLEEPLPMGQELAIATENKDGHLAPAIPFTLNYSRRQDPTVSYTPALSAKSNPFAAPEDREYGLTAVIERIAYTPFGIRIVVNNENIGNGTYFSYAFADSNGKLLSPYTDIVRSNSNASLEHPAWTRNEKWFLFGKAANEIHLVPVQHIKLDGGYGQFLRTAYVPIDSLPAAVQLEEGGTVLVQAVSIEKDGFLVSYTLEGYADYIYFDLAGEGSKPLNLNFISFSSVDLAQGLLQAGGYWSSEYKGRRVARVTAEDIENVKELSIHYYAGTSVLKPEEAVVIKLKH